MVDTNICYEELRQAATTDEIAIDYNNLSDMLFKSLQNNITQCEI